MLDESLDFEGAVRLAQTSYGPDASAYESLDMDGGLAQISTRSGWGEVYRNRYSRFYNDLKPRDNVADRVDCR